MYQNFKELKNDTEKYHSVVLPCEITNYEICKEKCNKAIEKENVEEAIIEMAHLTSLYDYATKLSYSKEMGKVCKMSLKAVKIDFQQICKEIEDYFCKEYRTGHFEINEEILHHNSFMVDWDAYWNKSSRNFIDGCKEANKIVGYSKDDEISKYYYEEDKERYNFEEIFHSSYNGGRVIASFKKMDDALMWSYHGDAHQEEDGLWWAEQPAY